MKEMPEEAKMKKIKEILRSLDGTEVSSSVRQKFISRLSKIEQPKTVLEKARVLNTRFTLALKDITYGIKYAFAVPHFEYARIAVLAFIAVSLYAYGFLPQAPMVHAISGTVKIFSSNRNEWVFASDKMRIAKDDIVKTFGDGSADISLEGVYSIRVKRDSEVKLESLSSRATDAPITFDVSKGKVLTYYMGSKGGSYKKLDIRTEELIASAIGTNFMVETAPLFHKSWVSVLDGVVRVRSANIPPSIPEAEATVFVNSKYRTEVSEGGIPKKPEMMMEDEWFQLEELYSVGKKPQVALLVSTGPTRMRELLSMAPLFISDKKPSVLPDRLMEAATLFNQAIKEKSNAKHVKTIGMFEEIVEQYPNPKSDVQFMLFIGAYYEYIDLHRKAIAAFEKALERYPRSTLAGIAQLAIGYIYEEKLNEPKKAKEAYFKVISDYPQSPEVEEALSGLHRLKQVE